MNSEATRVSRCKGLYGVGMGVFTRANFTSNDDGDDDALLLRTWYSRRYVYVSRAVYATRIQFAVDKSAQRRGDE